MQIRVSTCLPLPVSRSRLRCLTRQTPWENKGSQVFRGTLLRTNISHLGNITFPATFNGDMCDISHKLSKLVDFFEKHICLIPKTPSKTMVALDPSLRRRIDKKILRGSQPQGRGHQTQNPGFTLRQIIGWRGLQWKFAWKKIGHNTQKDVV